VVPLCSNIFENSIKAQMQIEKQYASKLKANASNSLPLFAIVQQFTAPLFAMQIMVRLHTPTHQTRSTHMQQYYVWQIWYTDTGPVAHPFPALPMNPGVETARALIEGMHGSPNNPVKFTCVEYPQGPVWFGHVPNGITTYIICPAGPIPESAPLLNH
jgi:hypothetical protein